MPQLPNVRQEQILAWLRHEQQITIEVLVERLAVSAMTIHRDLDSLAQAGHIEKVRGGAVLSNRGMPGETAHQCVLCAMRVPLRTTFIINTTAGQQIHACCPHCGLMLLEQHTDTDTVLARDFLYGRMVNAGDAFFLVDSEVAVCCTPSVLCFGTEQDAQRFRQGFGGVVLDYHAARTHLSQRHRSVLGNN
ncbi:MAG: DeoR family transcriptional regulator [Anaerolineaceae bacterium]|nr:DeoR family transcriptional regulator [Anaerolineaceae bacterium]